MKYLTYSLLALGLVQSTTAMAQQPNFSYNTFGLEFGKTDVSVLDDNLTTMGIGASLAFNDDVFAFADYQRLAGDNVNGVDIRYSRTNLGLGLVFPVKKNIDVVGKFSYVMEDYEECNGGCLELDDDGFNLGLGVNYWLTQKFDASVGIDYTEYEDSNENYTYYRFGVGYWPSKAQRVGLSYQNTDRDGVGNLDTFVINYRISQ